MFPALAKSVASTFHWILSETDQGETNSTGYSNGILKVLGFVENLPMCKCKYIFMCKKHACSENPAVYAKEHDMEN